MHSETPEIEKRIRAQVEAYSNLKSVYEELTEFLTAVFSRAMRKMEIMAIVSSRAKEVRSFAEKVVRKQDKYSDPVNQFDDLCGSRIIVNFVNEIDPVCDFIRRYFDIDEAGSEDVAQRLDVSQFGYRGVHLTISLNKKKIEKLYDDMNLGPKGANIKPPSAMLYRHRSEKECTANKLTPGPKFKAEVQVRTLLQHAWAECAHDRIYKSDFDVPDKLIRDTNRIAAALENADSEFVRAIKGVESYRTYYGAYMTKADQQNEMKKLETVLRYDPDNMRLAYQISRLAMSLEMWGSAKNHLEPFVTQWEKTAAARRVKKAAKNIFGGHAFEDDEPAPIESQWLGDPLISETLLEYGQALWRSRRKSGRKYIEWAIAMESGNVDAWIALSKTYLDEKKESKALECYEMAFKNAPADPNALSGFIQCKISDERSLNFIPMVRPSLEAGIQTCKDRSEVGVYLPQAFYDIGLFSLLLERPYDSLNAFAAAVIRSHTESEINETLSRIVNLQQALKSAAYEKFMQHMDCVRRFLVIVKAVKAILSEIGSAADTDKRATLELRKKSIKSFKKRLKDLCSRNLPMVRRDKPIIIVAGGCDSPLEEKINEYRSLLDTAFEEFTGTVFCGGTRSGISGLVGDLDSSAKMPMQKLAYLPRSIPSWTSPHDAYEILYTHGGGFSALEPIQNWIDLLALGVDPSTVKLLGINGGVIASFEFRMALAMGARVGVIRDSGRAAFDIFKDENWNDIPGLIMLPNDPQTVKTFVQGIPQSEVLTGEDRQTMAIEAHKNYQEKHSHRHVKKDPALADWHELPSDLKHSNMQQIDHIEEKLRTIGYGIRKVETGPIQVKKFLKPKIDHMAEMEHGRWNVERLLSGWSLGERDIDKKTSPYLVSWSDLPESIRKYDRQAVVAIPNLLKQYGYKIVPLK